MLDQRRLPAEVRYHRYRKPDEVVDAIRDMVVRGAPAIGIAAAYALAMVARDETGDGQMFLVANGTAGRILNATRPTAVNLALGHRADVSKGGGGLRARARGCGTKACSKRPKPSTERMWRPAGAWVSSAPQTFRTAQ